jgi:glycosyltransferase involved in cell wall biosynthesis
MRLAFNTFAGMENQQRVVMLASNDLATDQRIKKMCSSIEQLGYSITLIGRVLPDSLPMDRPYTTKRIRLLFNKGALFYTELNIRLFFLLLFTSFDVVHANDLDTLLPAFLVSKLKGKKLVYDSHEIFPEVPEVQGRWVKKVWQILERFLVSRLDAMITVNDSIAAYYHKKYGLQVKTIRNIPERKTLQRLQNRIDLDLPSDAFILIAQGTGINVDRGMEELVEALKNLQGVLLLLVGSGDVIPKLKRQVEEEKLTHCVRFVDRLPYDEMMQYTFNANLGVTLDKPTSLNYAFSLPNKIFDYIHAGIPVLASDLVEIRKIVTDYNVGILLESVDPACIRSAIESMRNDPDFPNSFIPYLSKAKSELTWEKEAQLLASFYPAV